MNPIKHFIASHSHRPSHAAHTSKVVLTPGKADAEEVSQALGELKEGKRLYYRENSRGERILTTRAPRWYRFNAKQEQKSVVELLRPVLSKITLDPQVNLTAMDALYALNKDARYTPSLRSAVKQMAVYAAGMRYTPKAESRHAVKHPQPDVAAEGPAPTESALPNTVEADLKRSTNALMQADVRLNIEVEQPKSESEKPAMQDLNTMTVLQRGLAISRMSAAEKEAQGIRRTWDRECKHEADQVNRLWDTSLGKDFAASAGRMLKHQLGLHDALHHTGMLGYLRPEARYDYLKGMGGEALAKAVLAETE